MVRQGFCCREYLVDGQWLPEPKGRVQGNRYNLEGICSAVCSLADIWKYIKERSIQPPEKPDKILEQLARARLMPEKVRLFSPWGPRYNRRSPRIAETDPEIATLREIRGILDRCRESGYSIDLLLMLADVYGTEINSLSPDFVREYCRWLEERAYKEVGEVKVKLWSAIRDEQRRRYDSLSRAIDQNFNEWIKKGEYQNAVGVAKVFSPGNAEQSARRYCRERVVEGIIISEVYDPIKLSLVKKEKDSLDGPLKRIYIVKNKAPWLGGE